MRIFAPSRYADVDANIAVAITILDKLLEPNLHDALLGRDLIPRDGFSRAGGSPARASNASDKKRTKIRGARLSAQSG